MDIQKSISGYPKIHFWISKNQAEFWISIIRFLDIHNSFLDIRKSMYFKIHFWISKNHAEFSISIIRFLDINNLILEYLKIRNISMYSD